MSDLAEIRNHTEIVKLRTQIFSYALSQGFGVALWRLPNTSNSHLIISENSFWLDDVIIEEARPGFILSPFKPTGKKLFLEANHLLEIIANDITENTTSQFIDQASQFESNKPVSFYKQDNNTQIADDFVDLVKLSINAIEAGTFDKVVPSKTRQVPLQSDFNLLDAFDRLCLQYPNALISLVSHPEVGTWLGASPELLVSVDKNNIFRTVALAGTQALKTGTALRSITWTQKEIEEQALVERYIISCFKKIRVREYDEHGPKTVQAGNLLHLRSDFEVDMKAVNYPQLGSVMLKLLHPTSAVCGMPMEAAYQFLESNEGYEREFYAGYLGPVNIQAECHLFVNLRCVKWCGDYLQQFAGAGVTIDSVPEAELKEVTIKLDTVRHALGL
jgi:isochorismate synthase